MKLKDVLALQQGNNVNRRRYGPCEVQGVMLSCGNFFGVRIRPKTNEGKGLLALDSHTDIQDFLEDSIKQFK